MRLINAAIISLVFPTAIGAFSIHSHPNYASLGTAQNTNHGIFGTKHHSRMEKLDTAPDIQDLARKIAISTSLSVFLAASAFVNIASAFDSTVYTGDYADPFHPYCERHIQVSSDRKTFHYSGTGVGPKGDTVLRGCTSEEQEKYGLRQGAFDGLIINEGRGISAGDGIHEGLWEAAGFNTKEKYGEVDGVRWNDGNKWVRLSSSISPSYVVDGNGAKKN